MESTAKHCEWDASLTMGSLWFNTFVAVVCDSDSEHKCLYVNVAAAQGEAVLPLPSSRSAARWKISRPRIAHTITPWARSAAPRMNSEAGGAGVDLHRGRPQFQNSLESCGGGASVSLRT